jgi:hypothetical protein
LAKWLAVVDNQFVESTIPPFNDLTTRLFNRLINDSTIQLFDHLTDSKYLMTHTDDQKCRMLFMIKIIRKMFLDSPDKSQIKLEGECQSCKKPMAIDIVPTPGGFGIMGGVLTDITSDRHYRLLCPKCHTLSRQNNKMTDDG